MNITKKIYYFTGFFGIFSIGLFILTGLNEFIFFLIGMICIAICVFIYYLRIFYILTFGTKEEREKIRRFYMTNEEKMAEDLEVMKKELSQLKKEKNI